MSGPAIERVHLLFKTHLDLGFTAPAAEVLDRYLDDFIPRALQLAAELRARGGTERFVWTTGSWLVHTALERGSTGRRRQLEHAIEAGDLVWHALPFTTHTELLDPLLCRFGLSYSAALDRRFGRHTTTAKLTDVPGHTRSLVPILAEAGVRLLHIGVNPASTPPDVPDAFIWRDEATDSEVTVLYQRGGYGDVSTVRGSAHALAFAHSGDNLGPPTADEVVAAHAAMARRMPGAVVVASTLDAFAAAIRPDVPFLPVITAELGDTWIHGAGTDPRKVARFRELRRLRAGWVGGGGAEQSTPGVREAGEALLLVAEHTWGLDVKTYLPDTSAYSATELAQLRTQPDTQRLEESWAEQRAYIDRALVALDGTPYGPEARAALLAIEPFRMVPSADDGWVAMPGGRPATITDDELSCTVDHITGSVTSFADTGRDRRWEVAGPSNHLGRLGYQTFSAEAYDRFHAEYNCASPEDEWWAVRDFTKPGIAAGGAIDRWWIPKVTGIWRRAEGPDGPGVLLELAGPPAAVEQFGCPPVFTLEYRLDASSRSLEIILQWFDKPACRMPEALWFSFVPRVREPERWFMYKLGRRVSPLDVVPGGSRQLHAIDRSVVHDGPDGAMLIGTLDAPLVAPGKPSLLAFSREQPDLAEGWHVNLANNVWGTNFPMWIEGDARFRFDVRLA